MCTRNEQMFDRIFFLRTCSDNTFTPAALGSEVVDRSPLDVTSVRDRNHHRLFFNDIFQIDFPDFLSRNLGFSIFAILATDLTQILFDHSQHNFTVSQDRLELRDFQKQLGVFCTQPLLLQVDQLPQRHLQDGICLNRC